MGSHSRSYRRSIYYFFHIRSVQKTEHRTGDRCAIGDRIINMVASNALYHNYQACMADDISPFGHYIISGLVCHSGHITVEEEMKTTEPNQAPETRYVLVTLAASHPARQARICLI